jgi:sec-independent protein translocase protein TatC
VLALARMGVVTAGFLARHTKYAILIIFIVAAVVTPTSDVVTQAMMAAPMIVLYGLSIVIAWIFGRRKASR